MSPEERIKKLEQRIEVLERERRDIGDRAYHDNSMTFGKVHVGGAFITSGAGGPAFNVQAPRGSLYMRNDGGSSTTLYVKHGDGIAAWSGLA